MAPAFQRKLLSPSPRVDHVLTVGLTPLLLRSWLSWSGLNPTPALLPLPLQVLLGLVSEGRGKPREPGACACVCVAGSCALLHLACESTPRVFFEWAVLPPPPLSPPLPSSTYLFS